MKKLIVALMALSVMTLSFTSCEKTPKADPATKPVAGHSYQYTDAKTGGYLKVTFQLNYKCSMEVRAKKDTEIIFRDLYTWEMEGNKIEIRYGENTAVNGVPMDGVLFYNGEYDAAAKRVTLKNADNPAEVYPCDLVQ